MPCVAALSPLQADGVPRAHGEPSQLRAGCFSTTLTTPPTCVVISQESSQFAIWKQLAQFTASAASINVDGTINYREAGTDTEDAIMAAARAWGTEATLWKAAGGGGEGPVPLQY